MNGVRICPIYCIQQEDGADLFLHQQDTVIQICLKTPGVFCDIWTPLCVILSNCMAVKLTEI